VRLSAGCETLVSRPVSLKLRLYATCMNRRRLDMLGERRIGGRVAGTNDAVNPSCVAAGGTGRDRLAYLLAAVSVTGTLARSASIARSFWSVSAGR